MFKWKKYVYSFTVYWLNLLLLLICIIKLIGFFLHDPYLSQNFILIYNTISSIGENHTVSSKSYLIDNWITWWFIKIIINSRGLQFPVDESRHVQCYSRWWWDYYVYTGLQSNRGTNINMVIIENLNVNCGLKCKIVILSHYKWWNINFKMLYFWKLKQKHYTSRQVIDLKVYVLTYFWFYASYLTSSQQFELIYSVIWFVTVFTRWHHMTSLCQWRLTRLEHQPLHLPHSLPLRLHLTLTACSISFSLGQSKYT